MAAMQLTTDQIHLLTAAGREDLVRAYHAAVMHPLNSFRPRPDRPDEFDEQTAFVNSQAKFSVCLGGTGSGKTHAAAYRTARFVLDHLPPRPRCPFWIIGETFEQVCAACWDEKLSTLIPTETIWNIDWYRPNRNWPFAVTLRDPRNRDRPGWCLEFKSYSQGRAHMQARSIGGYWFNEECPFEIVEEVMGRCRDYDSPGWADFTPIDVRSPEWPEFYDHPPPDWRFFHLNTEMNDALAPGWAERYLATVPEDMRDTRRTGVFASYSGQVFKEFRRAVHVIPAFALPHNWRRIRGIDFGFNNPFCCLWIARDGDGRYYVYDEHYRSRALNAEHAREIKRRAWDTHSPVYGPTYSDHDAQQRAELAQLDIHTTLANKSSIARRIALLRSLMLVQPDGKPRLYIFERCKNLIRELRLYKWPTAGGGDNARNPADLPVDKDNHCLVDKTLVSTDHGQIPIIAVTTDDKVWTRQGWKRVLFSGPTRRDITHCVSLSNGGTLEGTADHPVWVMGHGWTPLGSLTPGDVLCQESRDWTCNRQPSALCSTACRIGDTPIPSGENCGFTSFLSKARGFTGRNEPACSAVHHSPSVGTARQLAAPVHVVSVSRGSEKKQTYDLTVEGAHEFFANGVLVHNCIDAMGYAIYTDHVGPLTAPQPARREWQPRAGVLLAR